MQAVNHLGYMNIGVKNPVLPTVETIHVLYTMELVSDVLQDG